MSDCLDQNILSELKTIMAEDFTLLIDTYLSDSSKQIDRLQQYWQSQDMISLRRVAHSLKGSCGNIGATRLAELCGQLEMRLIEERLCGMEESLRQVALEYKNVAHSIRNS